MLKNFGSFREEGYGKPIWLFIQVFNCYIHFSRAILALTCPSRGELKENNSFLLERGIACWQFFWQGVTEDHLEATPTASVRLTPRCIIYHLWWTHFWGNDDAFFARIPTKANWPTGL